MGLRWLCVLNVLRFECMVTPGLNMRTRNENRTSDYVNALIIAFLLMKTIATCYMADS